MNVEDKATVLEPSDNVFRFRMGKVYLDPTLKTVERGFECLDDEVILTDKFEFATMYSKTEFDAVITDYKGISDIYSKMNRKLKEQQKLMKHNQLELNYLHQQYEYQNQSLFQ